LIFLRSYRCFAGANGGVAFAGDLMHITSAGSPEGGSTGTIRMAAAHFW
jgi:hypothetical protein